VTLRVLELAENEAIDAACWYENKCDGLGVDFLSRYESILTAIEADPHRFPLLETLTTERNIRRCVMKRFPYYVVYELLDSETVVLAVAHSHRRPNYWQRRRTR